MSGRTATRLSVHHVLDRATTTADAPTVLLVHGVGSDHTAWDAVAAELTAHATVVRYDLRGHGRSAVGTLPYSLDDFVADHVELMARLGIGRAHLVGFSLGGLIAQAVAIRHPELVDRLAVIGAVAGRTDAERERALTRLEDARRTGPAGTSAASAARWFTTGFVERHPDAVARNLRRMADTDAAAYAAAYEVLATNDLADELARVGAPTLAMTGEHDVGSPPHMSEMIAERVPNGRVVILDGHKHGVLDEAPWLVARELTRFLFPPKEMISNE